MLVNSWRLINFLHRCLLTVLCGDTALLVGRAKTHWGQLPPGGPREVVYKIRDSRRVLHPLPARALWEWYVVQVLCAGALRAALWEQCVGHLTCRNRAYDQRARRWSETWHRRCRLSAAISTETVTTEALSWNRECEHNSIWR